MTLKELAIGKSAVIRTVGASGALRQHFLDMGMIPGAEVTVVKFAPMGDPMARTRRRRTAPQAISPVQQRRPQPAAETGRNCWGRVLIFQSPAKGLRKNQLTQPVAVA